MKTLLKKENNIKNVDEYVENFLTENNLDRDSVLVKFDEFNKSVVNLKRYDVSIVIKDDLIEYLKEYINTITSALNLQTDLTIKFDDEILKIHIDSDNNSILIGKDGRMLNSMQVILKQTIKSQTDMNIKVYLDIADYKEKQNKEIEDLARKIAEEVENTKESVKLDSMNSYQRRLVHNVISEYKNLTTKSEGEEPNRYVVVKYND